MITGITRDLSAALNVDNTLSVLPRDLTTTTNLVGELARYVCEGVKTLVSHVIQTVYQTEHSYECMYIICIHFMEYVCWCILYIICTYGMVKKLDGILLYLFSVNSYPVCRYPLIVTISYYVIIN